MNSFIIIIVTAAFAFLNKPLDAGTTTTVCDYNVCECNNNSVSCTKKFPLEPPFAIPNDTTTVHFVDVLIDVLNNNTFTGGELQKITWVSSNITMVEPLHIYKLKYLDLSRNNIFKLLDGTFDYCPQLEYVDLSNNQLRILSDDLFTRNKMLQTLKIEKNIFYSISERLFRETNNLKHLSIGNPYLTILAENAMANLDKLEFLSIENSSIENLNKSSFGEHKYLNSILLNNCIHLTKIDNNLISSAPNIEFIELNNCSKIDFLPPNIVSLKKLKRLQLFETEIQPNCHNGWFSNWLNKTNSVIGYKKDTHFIETINKLLCPAKIYYTSNSITLQLTKKGIIDCMAFGNPLPSITWLVPGGLTFHANKEADTNLTNHPSAHNWDLNQIDSQSLLINKNGSLHILRMLRTNIGNYTCYVSNIYGNDSKTLEVHLDSEVFFNIKINALILGISSALGFLMLTILCCAFKLLLIRLVSSMNNNT